MRASNVALLTLAALASQNLTAKTSANPAPVPISDRTPQASNFVDAIDRSALRPVESISAPETIGTDIDSVQFSPRSSVGKPVGLLVASAHSQQFDRAPSKIDSSALPSQEELTKSLEQTWLAKLIESGANASPQVRDALDFLALRSGGESGDFNNTTTVLNVLLILATLFPPVTIGFFWLVRNSIVKQLVADANKRLQGIGILESELRTSSQLTQKLKDELEMQMIAAKESVEFLTRETELSKASVEQIETLKSQFLMHLQVLLTEVYEKKSQIVQEIDRVPQTVANKTVKPAPQQTPDKSQQQQVVTAAKSEDKLIADDYIKQGESLYIQGNYEGALSCFDKSILLNQNIDEAWYWRGNVLIKLERPEEAIASYEQAISIKPDRYEAWYNKANLLGKLQRYAEAILSYEQACAIAPENYTVWHTRAAMLGKLQRFQEAIACYDRALTIKDTDSEIWHNRGAMLGKIQQHSEAIASYDRALEINPNRYETWYNRGNMLWRLLRYADAVVSYDRAIAIQPDKYEVWYNRGAVLGRMHCYQEAIEAYEKAIAIKPNDFEVWHNRGVAFEKLSQYESAITSYDRAIAIKENCYEAWFGKGESFIKLQKYEEALTAYDTAISIEQNSYDAWRRRGTVLSELKRYEEAMAAYDKAIAIKPENAEAWRERGVLESEFKQDTNSIESSEGENIIQPDAGGKSEPETNSNEEANEAVDRAVETASV
ncbi:MAG: tetratricopeptide repeat protein [Microcoleus sp.]